MGHASIYSHPNVRSGLAWKGHVSPRALGEDREASNKNDTLWVIISVAGAMAAGYHGYKQSKGSLSVALGWSVLGLLFPVVTTAIAVAEGYAKPNR